MITLPIYQIKEASRVYGDFVEKVAFDLSIDPAMVLGSVAGGYAANSVYNQKKEKHMEKQKIENNYYSQVETLLRDLKIVFTPINVVYSVNGQVFEIIKTDEMTPHMRRAFLQRDGHYFRDLLLNKINMEIQLAEQAFAQRLLAAKGYGGQAKVASYTAKQDCLVNFEQDDFDTLVKTASEGMEEIKLSISPTFDTLRPFHRSEIFFNEKEFTKVAGIFSMFNSGHSEDIGLNRINREVNVGFLPDRVVFLWNGHLIEQMSLLNMNEDGYEAFRMKDKDFFMNLFKKHTIDVSKNVKKDVKREKKASEEDIELEKEADALEDIVGDLLEGSIPIIEREWINPFVDPDLHPMAYDLMLSDKYGAKWANNELESILKQLEVDFQLEKGIEENPINKISILHTVSGPEHAMYQAPLTFEKFIRGVNSKSILFEEFEGNLSFEEILFGLEIAKASGGDNVFVEFHDNIAPYVSEELFNQNIRFISDQVYDEKNEAEKDFFESVNGYLLRKWRERDTQGLNDESEILQRKRLSFLMVEIADTILRHHAEKLDVTRPYSSTLTILEEEHLLKDIPNEYKESAKHVIQDNVAIHLMGALFLEYKHRELEFTVEKLKEEGVLRG